MVPSRPGTWKTFLYGSRFPAAKCLRKGAKSSASKRPAVALDNIINNGAMMLIQKRVGKAKIFCFFPKEISSRQKNGCAFCVDKKLSNIFLLLLLLLLLLLHAVRRGEHHHERTRTNREASCRLPNRPWGIPRGEYWWDWRRRFPPRSTTALGSRAPRRGGTFSSPSLTF